MYECAGHLARQGHAVDVFANKWEQDPSGRVTYHHVPMPKQPPFLRVAWHYRAATKLIRNHDLDVLNVHGCICPTGGVHWVQSLHRSWLERSKGFRKSLSTAAIKQKVNPLHPILLHLEARHFAERRYKKLIATTTKVRDDLNRFYGVPAADVEIIPNGFNPVEFNPQRRAERRSAEREKLGLNDDHVALLLAANELDRKGYGTILAAMRQLDQKNIRLLVVGRPDPARVKKLAADAGLADQVIACGHTSDVAAYHAASDLFVLPTQYEAFSLAILESLGSGLPVVTSRVPGACDAIQPGINGDLIDDPTSGSQLAAVLQPLLDNRRRDTVAAGCPASVTQYQWPSVLARYESLLVEHATSSVSSKASA
jgi:UDP-glucose:(heptosyl)LPS alpha-1,3-glucosyltransferase